MEMSELKSNYYCLKMKLYNDLHSFATLHRGSKCLSLPFHNYIDHCQHLL